MSSNYTPTPTLLTGTVTIPSDGDLEEVASVNPAFQKLADAVAFNARPATNNASRYALASRALPRVVRSTPLFDPGNFLYGSVPSIQLTDQNSSGTICSWVLSVPDGSTLNGARIYVHPAGGHGGLPTQPSISIVKHNLTSNAFTTIGSVTDAQVSVVAYELRHTFVLSGLTEVIDNTNFSYYLQFTGESGGSAQPLLKVEFPLISFTTTAQDDGAS